MNNSNDLHRLLVGLAKEWHCGVIKVYKAVGGRCSCRNPECKAPGKHPLENGWQNNKAVSDKDIQNILRQSGKFNIGLALSESLSVVDVDPRNSGDETLKGLPIPPISFKQKTGGEGQHLFFDTSNIAGLQNANGLYEGIDFKTKGGFVVIEPSSHKSGGSYKFSSYDIPKKFPKLPEKIVEDVRTYKKTKKNRFRLNSDEKYAEGRRNDVISSLFGQLRYQGMSFEQAVDVASMLNSRRCVPPLEIFELNKIAKSIFSYPQMQEMITLPKTEIGLARRFEILHKDSVLLLADTKKVFRWDGTRYATLNAKYPVPEFETLGKEIEILSRQETSEEAVDEMMKLSMSCQYFPKIKNITQIIQNSSSHNLNKFDENINLLNFLNGTFDLKKQVFRAHDRNDRITKLIPYAYDSTATCPTFLRFQDDIYQGNKELMKFVQKLFGYSLSGERKEQIFVVKYGEGSNGKSTESELHLKLLGDYASSASISSFLEKKLDGIRNDLARLVGTRLVSASEVGLDKYLDESQIKEMTGGEKLTVRFLYNENFSFVPQFLVVLTLNNKPKIRGTDNGIWRRIVSIPYSKKFEGVQNDKELSNKLTNELPGIMNWALEGYRLWKSEGLQPFPSIVCKSNELYRQEENPVADFISEVLEFYSGSRLLFSEIREYANDWTRKQGIASINDKLLGMALVKMGAERANGNNGTRIYLNIRRKLVNQSALNGRLQSADFENSF